MSDLIHIAGWDLVQPDGAVEPLIPDDEIGRQLGYADPSDAGELVERMIAAKKLPETIPRATRDNSIRRAGRPVRLPRLLTEAQALKVIAKSETDIADKILDEVIAVYVAWRRGVLPPAATAPALTRAQIVEIVTVTIEAMHTTNAERDTNGGLIGARDAQRFILAEFRAIATLGAQPRSKAWRATHRKLQNDLRDECRIKTRGAWRDLPERHLGDIRSKLVIIRQDAEKAGGPQLKLLPGPKGDS